jgi:hypothetical protein
MLAPKAPRSVYDHRPVAVQVVKQQKSGAVDKHVLIVDQQKARPEPSRVAQVHPQHPDQEKGDQPNAQER